MIRVVHYIGSLESGGSQAMIMNIYRNIDRSKLQFDFIVHDKENVFYRKEIMQLGGKIYLCPAYNGKNHFKYMKWWDNFFDEHKEYRIFHCHVRSTSFICIRSAKRHGLMTIVHSHSTSNGTEVTGKIKDIMQYPTRFIANYFFACSKSAGIWMFGKKVTSSKRFCVIKNSIDAKKYIYNPEIRSKIRTELGIKNQFVVGHIGRFMEAKNHTFLIDVFNELQKTKPNSLLLLVGDGPLKKQIMKKVHMLGLDKKVIFLGVRNDIPDVLQAMDVFVFPSTYEGLGIVAIEAQAAGLLTLCSDVIPREVCITELCKFISIQNRKEWINLIDNSKMLVRTNRYEEIVNANYDIINQTKLLSKFYLKLNR